MWKTIFSVYILCILLFRFAYVIVNMKIFQRKGYNVCHSSVLLSRISPMPAG